MKRSLRNMPMTNPSSTLTRPRRHPGHRMMALMSTPTPPDLSRPYLSAAERARDVKRLLACWSALEALIELSSVPPEDWSPSQTELAGTFPPADQGVPVPPAAQAERLRRSARLFEDELRLIKRTQNRLMRQDVVTDAELVGNTWLARQVLGAITGEDAAYFSEPEAAELIAARAKL